MSASKSGLMYDRDYVYPFDQNAGQIPYILINEFSASEAMSACSTDADEAWCKWLEWMIEWERE